MGNGVTRVGTWAYATLVAAATLSLAAECATAGLVPPCWAVIVDSTGAGAADVPKAPGGYHRIIALSPAVTEIVYALGGEDRLVGIAQFSDYPPRAMKEKPVVGGILNVDIEKVLALKADLIITPPGAMVHEKIEHLGIRLLYAPDKTLDDIATSFVTVGTAIGKEVEGRVLAAWFKAAIAAARERNKGSRPVKTLVVIGYEPLWVAGGYGALDELLAAAGGTNAGGTVRRDFYQTDIESVVVARPDVIVDLTLHGNAPQAKRDAVKAFWARFGSIPAIKNGRVEFVDIDLLTIPGPRLLDGLAALEKVLKLVSDTNLSTDVIRSYNK